MLVLSNGWSDCHRNSCSFTLRLLHTAENHSPTMFHMATVGHKRWDPCLLYRTSLNKLPKFNFSPFHKVKVEYGTQINSVLFSIRKRLKVTKNLVWNRLNSLKLLLGPCSRGSDIPMYRFHKTNHDTTKLCLIYNIDWAKSQNSITKRGRWGVTGAYVTTSMCRFHPYGPVTPIPMGWPLPKASCYLIWNVPGNFNIREISLTTGAGGLLNWAKFYYSFSLVPPDESGAQTDDPPHSAGLKIVDPPHRPAKYAVEVPLIINWSCNCYRGKENRLL